MHLLQRLKRDFAQMNAVNLRPLGASCLGLRDIRKLLVATRGRFATRDRCLVLLTFGHGLRVGEVCSLRVSDVDLKHRELHLREQRKPKTNSRLHPLTWEEMESLEAWLVQREHLTPGSDTLFVSAHRTQVSRKTVWLLLKRLGQAAGIQTPVYPDILRHSCIALLYAQGLPGAEIDAFLGRTND